MKTIYCVRCHRDCANVGGLFPDGRLCATCYRTAIRTKDTCAHCGQHRLVPCRNAEGLHLCVDCGGSEKNFKCKRCPNEWALRNGVCERCRLDDRLKELTGGGAVDLTLLTAPMLEVSRPDSLLIWLRNPDVPDLLRSLAQGRISLTHEALDSFEQIATADHLRHLLTECGLLPGRDPVLARYDRWLRMHLDTTAEHREDVRLLDQYVTWNQRRRMVAASEAGELRSAQINASRQTLRVSGQFLDWLRTRDQTLATCRQSDLDEWLATPPTTRMRVRGFIRWAKDTKRMPALQMVKENRPTLRPLDQQERLTVISRLLDPNPASCANRCVGLLLALYAQPVSRIVALRTEALAADEASDLTIKLGSEPVPIPPPFDQSFRQLQESNWQRNTHNGNSQWLFPGVRAGTHIAAASARKALIRIAQPILQSRHAALRQLVIDCPPPVVADMIGYTHNATTNHATRAGSPWLTYAATRHRSQLVQERSR